MLISLLLAFWLVYKYLWTIVVNTETLCKIKFYICTMLDFIENSPLGSVNS